MQPRRLTPRFLEKVWGATHLEPWFPDSTQKIGEVWLEGDPGLPLLIKFLFTTGKLSVQVHPGDEYAAEHHQSLGKTEMWHVVRAEPGAKIAAGFHQQVTKTQLEVAARSGEIENLLEWFDARPGDTFFLPAGTVHAIGPGLALLEIQQNSDITYRLYDYGRPRELHMEQGIAVSSLGPHAARVVPNGDVLVDCPYFTASRFELRGGEQIATSSLHTYLIVIEGTCVVSGVITNAGEGWYLPPGSSAEVAGTAISLLIRAH
jgi:mannose-6-phosphate isomerase